MTRSLLLLAAATLTVSSALAQHPHRNIPNPTNLQVLDKSLTGQQVVEIMHKWEGDLGVECNYCHAQDATTHRLNFASDANPLKTTARTMLKMNMAINKEFLTQLTPPAENPVHCGTCHRGSAKPTVFTPAEHEHEHHEAPPPAPAK